MNVTRKTRTRKPAAKRRAGSAPVPAAGPSPRELWLAGLGAALVAGETARDAVDALVVRGREREPRVVAAAERVARDARSAVEETAAQAARISRRMIDDALERFGQRPAPRQKNILHRLGDLAEALL